MINAAGDFGAFDSFGALSQTPLPAALPLLATGLGALGLLGWRRKWKKAAALAAGRIENYFPTIHLGGPLWH